MAKVRARILPSGAKVWQAAYLDGAGQRRSKQFALKRDADAFLIKTGSQLADGIHVAERISPTVGEAAKLWLAKAAADGLEPSTIAAYEQHARLHIIPAIGAIRLSKLSAPSIEEFRDTLAETRSRAMVKRVVTSLYGICKEAQRRGLAAVNPVQATSGGRSGKRQARPEKPTKDELRAILAAASGRWRPLIWTSAFTGMRGSELRGLAWRHVDLENGMISVRQRADLKKKIGLPKSDSGIRDIPIPPKLSAMLAEWKLECPSGPLDLVFPNGSGNVEYHQNILKRGFSPLQVAAGVTRLDDQGQLVAKYGLHALRHAAAALFIEQGLKPKRVQALMGHASIQITFDTYGYLFPADAEDRDAMRAIEASLTG